MSFLAELLAEFFLDIIADVVGDEITRSRYIAGGICLLIGIVILVVGRNATSPSLILVVLFGLAFFGFGAALVLIATFARKSDSPGKLTGRVLPPKRRRRAHSNEAKRK